MNQLKQLKKIDDVLTLKFLTSFAQVAASKGILKAADADNFKMQCDLLDFNKESSVLAQLIEQQSDILNLCVMRYGEIGFSINILKYGLKEYVKNSAIIICDTADIFTHFAKLFFNRILPYKIDNNEFKKIFLSQIFLDTLEVLGQALDNLKVIHKDLPTMNSCDFTLITQEDIEFDKELSKICGFKDIITDVLILNKLNVLKESINFSYKIIYTALNNFYELISTTSLKDQCVLFVKYCDEIKIQILKFDNLNIPKSSNLLLWQEFRTSVFDTLEQINTALTKAIDQIKSIFSLNFNFFKQYTINLASSSSIRQLAFFLVQEGINIHKAKRGAKNLLEYCKNNNIFPSQILNEELTRIDNCLSSNALNIFKTLEPDKEVAFQDNSKENNLQRLKKLESSFKNTLDFFKGLSVILILILSIILCNSCGLKLAPKSDIIDPRPQVEYKLQQEETMNTQSYNQTQTANESAKEQQKLKKESSAYEK